MDPPVDNDQVLRDNVDDDVNDIVLIPAEIDEAQPEPDMLLEDDVDLHSLGSRFRNIGVRAIFDSLKSGSGIVEQEAAIFVYLLYPDLRQDIVQELRSWIVLSECFELWSVERIFESLGELNIAEEVEQEHAEALLEFVDVIGPLIVEWRRKLQKRSFRPMPLPFQNISLPLHAPMGAIVGAKLLQYVQSVESIQRLALACEEEHQHRAFRPHEVEQLVTSIIHLKQLIELDLEIDMTGVLLVELCARLRDLENLSYLHIHGNLRTAAPQELPNERHLIRNIQQISSLETLRISFVILGESSVDLFSSSKGGCTRLELFGCRFLIGNDDEGRDPSELPLAVALASNTRLEELCFDFVQGSDAFYDGIEHGLLNNRKLQALQVLNSYGPAPQSIPERSHFGWMESIRLHPSLRRLELDMTTWSHRVADAFCSVVRDNANLYSIGLFFSSDDEASNNDFDPDWTGAVLQALQANRTIVDVRIEAGSDLNWNRLAELLTVNDSIQTVSFNAVYSSKPERVMDLLQRVKSNRTLKRLGIRTCFRPQDISALVELLSDNYALASLAFTNRYDNELGLGRENDPINCSGEGSRRLLRGILDLNYYGRNYMRTEPNSVVHGVSLLSHVSSNLDAVYFHLRENPRLCDRRESM